MLISLNFIHDLLSFIVTNCVKQKNIDYNRSPKKNIRKTNSNFGEIDSILNGITSLALQVNHIPIMMKKIISDLKVTKIIKCAAKNEPLKEKYKRNIIGIL